MHFNTYKKNVTEMWWKYGLFVNKALKSLGIGGFPKQPKTSAGAETSCPGSSPGIIGQRT